MCRESAGTDPPCREVNLNQDDVFQAYRSLLFSIAYRMLGGVMDAEDCVQEAYVRWHQTVESGERMQSPKAYLCTIVTRLCIDQLGAARSLCGGVAPRTAG